MDISELIKTGTSVSLTISAADLREFGQSVAAQAVVEAQRKLKPPEAKTGRLLTPDDVCALLGVTRPTLWAWNKKGILENFRIGNLVRYREADIEAFVNKREP